MSLQSTSNAAPRDGAGHAFGFELQMANADDGQFRAWYDRMCLLIRPDQSDTTRRVARLPSGKRARPRSVDGMPRAA